MFGRFVPQILLSLQFWPMKLLSPGGIHSLVVTAVKSNISSRAFQRVHGNTGAFAAILADGSVITWGDGNDGGDSRAVQDQLRNVREIHATGRAFAAILADGAVVTWGDAECGGVSAQVQEQLQNVQQIHGTKSAFAALSARGSLVTWGNPQRGADSRAVKDQLSYV